MSEETGWIPVQVRIYGRVTIPKRARQKYDINIGDIIEIKVKKA